MSQVNTVDSLAALRFPDEHTVRYEVAERLSGHFSFAERLIRYWLVTDKDTGFSRSTLSPIILRVLLSMGVRAARQFRSVIELCERGESADASIIARSMFETALVVGFVLKPRFTPREFNRQGKVTRTIKASSVSLTREFRALLFVTHHVLQPERVAAMHVQRPGMRQYSKHMASIVSRDGVSRPYTDAIGPEWTGILMRRPHTYSGLSIGNLARSLGSPFPQWYDQVYGSQSEHVHATDMLHHMQMDHEATTTPTWHESVEHVRGTLQTGIAMFYATIGFMNRHIQFGVGMNTALDGFYREYKRLIETE